MTYTCVVHIEWSNDYCGDECARLTRIWNAAEQTNNTDQEN